MAVLSAATLLAGCSGGGLFNAKIFKERASESPAPHEEGIEKTFFRNADGTPKNFLCAWSPEIGRGYIGESFLHRLVNEAPHCNLQWDITEDYLVGKMLNPSFTGKPEEWKTILKIRITKHYYFERVKDDHGRETNTWFENDTRSHYSARPYIKLNLSDIEVMQFTGGEFGTGARVTSVDEIEWDREKNFLGFSANVIFPAPRQAADEYQARMRFNFLKFDHDETFPKVRYDEENSKYMNILHVMGHKTPENQQILYASHWDLRQTKDIYISGTPNKKIADILVAAVERWNQTFWDIGAVPRSRKAFNPIVQDLKHPFDLRYTSINWIQDKRISSHSPLGIGMAHADRRNGQILWGGVVLYGGMLETYINRYAPVEASPAASAMAGLSPFTAFAGLIPKSMPPIPAVETLPTRPDLASMISQGFRDAKAEELARVYLEEELRRSGADAIRDQLETLKAGNPKLGRIASGLAAAAQNEKSSVAQLFSNMSLRDTLAKAENASAIVPDSAQAQQDPLIAALVQENDETKRRALMQSSTMKTSPFFMDADRTAANMAPQWKASSAQGKRMYPEMLESVVMDLTLHEVGHMLGLGHQFKENIVPKAGTVPEKYVRELGALANEENEFTNYSSVMGYRNGRVEMFLPADKLNPGPHDALVLRYLYKGEYTAYDRHRDQWVYKPVPESGRIPSVTKTAQGNLTTSYFPACNDYEASLDADPFCNRWDRGSRAEDIVASYFALLGDNLLSTLYSLVGGGSSSWLHEHSLWMNALNTFARTRLFYDEMRRRLRSENRLVGLWDDLRNDTDSLFKFSQVCQGPNPEKAPGVLGRIFAYPDMVDLCRANALALKEYGFFLRLPHSDSSRIDHTQRFISGGYLEGDVERDYGHLFGSWFELSNFPLKYTAMYALTVADPWQIRGPWLSKNMFYDYQENRFLYRTLYPHEYTRLISDAVQGNMRFTADGLDPVNRIGKTVMATSSLLPLQRQTENDSAYLPPEFTQMLNRQTQFLINMVGVVVTPLEPDPELAVKAEHYKEFTALLHDPITDIKTVARKVFILPKGEVLIWAKGMFLFPITALKFYQEKSAYVIAYKVTFDEEFNSLSGESVKHALLEKHDGLLKNCVDGVDDLNSNGLSSFFYDGNTAFEGFHIPPGIAEELNNNEKTQLFYNSIDKAFATYASVSSPKIPTKFPLKSMERVCKEAVKGVGQLSAAAALMNGYFMSNTWEYLEK